MISQGAVKINGNRVENLQDADIKNGDIIQVGKRNFVKVRINKANEESK